MHLVHQSTSLPNSSEQIRIPADRHTLARRRWRGTAEDGTDFGFDLSEALNHGDCVLVLEGKAYCIAQKPEACFLIRLEGESKAAWLGWMIGNLHFKASFSSEGILVQNDLAIEQMLEREHIAHEKVERIFQPAKSGGHSHDHSHDHHH